MVQVQREEMAKHQLQAVTGVYGLCCSHLAHIQCLLFLTSAAVSSASVPSYPSSPLASPSLTYSPSESSFLFFSPLSCLSAYLLQFSVCWSPSLLLLFHLLFPPLSHPLSPFSSKLIALKHSILLTSTPLCPPQSHITQFPPVLTSFCT